MSMSDGVDARRREKEGGLRDKSETHRMHGDRALEIRWRGR